MPASCGPSTSPRARPCPSATPLAVITATADEPIDDAPSRAATAPARRRRQPTPDGRPPAGRSAAAAPGAAAPRADGDGDGFLSPVVRRLLDEHGLARRRRRRQRAATGASPATTSWPRPPTDPPAGRAGRRLAGAAAAAADPAARPRRRRGRVHQGPPGHGRAHGALAGHQRPHAGGHRGRLPPRRPGPPRGRR